MKVIQTKLTLSKKKIHTELKCPHCNVGSLMLKKKDLMCKQYQSNIDEINELMDGVTGEYCPLPQKFIAVGIFTCNSENCQEYVSFRGEKLLQEYMRPNSKSEEDEAKEVETLTIHSLYPMVHLIPIYDQYPTDVKDLLIESFSLYLEHPSSCANKLRILVEKILDDLNIPSENSQGKRIITHARIEDYLKDIKLKEADYLMALKWVGNKASHDTVITQGDLPKIYEILNKVLDLLYLKSDEKLDNKVSMINDNKGFYE